jgi:hypothetical protein
VNVVAVVLALLVTLVTPLEPANATVTPVASFITIFSTADTLANETVEAATEPEILSVSTPAPPLIVSPVVIVALTAVLVALGAMNASLPAVPVKDSRLVVSGQVSTVISSLINKAISLLMDQF